jgi:hypothetical protein
MTPANNRQEAADRFWSDVEDLLKQKYRHPAPQARRGIDECQRDINDRNLGEVVYNQGEEQAAKVIDAVIKHGLPVPVRA